MWTLLYLISSLLGGVLTLVTLYRMANDDYNPSLTLGLWCLSALLLFISGVGQALYTLTQ